jgi:glycosyltransferase involved in cell wall biosynthesis
MPLLSIIVPIYNRANTLADALDSVFSQSFGDFELIAVDDGSTDDTPVILAGYCRAQPLERLRVFRQPRNTGAGTARNWGIAEARGEYCTFLDSDDLLFPWSLSVVGEAISAADRPPVILGRELRFDNAAEFSAVTREPLQTTAWPDVYAYGAQHHLGVTGTIIARTALLREVGGFVTEPMVGDGADLMLRLGIIPKMVKIDAPATYAYRVRPEHTTDQERWIRRAGELILRYRNSAFPGVPARAAELRRLLARDAGYFSIVCLYLGGWKNCLRLYLKQFVFQLRGRNYAYLLKTPFLFALSLLGLWPRRQRSAARPG